MADSGHRCKECRAVERWRSAAGVAGPLKRGVRRYVATIGTREKEERVGTLLTPLPAAEGV